jgi:hypothetical protein
MENAITTLQYLIVASYVVVDGRRNALPVLNKDS